MNNIGTKMNGKEATSKSLKPGSHLPKKNYFFLFASMIALQK